MTMDAGKINSAVGGALLDSVMMLTNEIIAITPRDTARLPLDPSVKVTWNLKRSIDFQQVWELEYKIGTKQWEAEYWKYLEFGTPRMAPRSFLRKGIADSRDKVLKNFWLRLAQGLK